MSIAPLDYFNPGTRHYPVIVPRQAHKEAPKPNIL